MSPRAAVEPLIHVGRQPIYDRNGDVVAYELLFRDTARATHATARSAEATSRVIVAAFTEFGLEQLAGSHACFINVTREFLVGTLPVPFGTEQSVLEIVETVDVDEAVVDGVRALVQQGFTIALDDFTLGSHEQLLDFATYVKIDLLGAEHATVEAAVRRCRQYPGIQLVAERLETEEDLHRAFALGFEFFQGHVLGQPHVVSSAALAPARMNRLRLLVALTAPDIDFDEVVTLVSQDPALTYRLLQATNSAASGLSSRVSSVREAAVLLGLDRVRQWVTLMLVSDVAEASPEQLALTLTRARACQAVAGRVGLPGDAAFTVGLLSAMADVLAESPATLAGRLPLAADVHEALAAGTGGLGDVLGVVLDYEKGDPGGLAELLSPDHAVSAYLNAVRWTTDLLATTELRRSRHPALNDA